MSKHTPGPWEWTPIEDGWTNCGPTLRSVEMGKAWDEYWGPDGNGTGRKHEDEPPTPTVLSAWGHDAWGIDVEEADARLIAAAPELLTALRDMVAWVDTPIAEQANPGWISGAVSRALAAIAKAEAVS